MPPDSKRRKLDDSTSRPVSSSSSRAASPSPPHHHHHPTASSSAPRPPPPPPPPSFTTPTIPPGPPSSNGAESDLSISNGLPPPPPAPAHNNNNPGGASGPPSSSSGRPTRPRLTTSDSGSFTGLPSRGDVINIDGYRDVRVMSIHYDDVVVCRAISILRGDQRVAIKFSLSAKASAGQQFKAEASLLGSLRESGVRNVTRIVARESGRLGAMLVCQDEDLHTFHETYLPRDRAGAASTPYWTSTPNLLRFLDHSIQLVRLVGQIHSLSVVHGSIRPAACSTSVFDEVHLHDFSTAFRQIGENGGNSAPIRERGTKEASLPYLAPECSGRVGKVADYRSDFYSLGATFYEILAGHVPFPDVEDPLDIVHAHVTKRPPLVDTIDESVPHELALVVKKLLEKAPDERYQTNLGLVGDLERIRTLVRLRGSGKSGDGLPDGEEERKELKKEEEGFVVGSVDEAAHFRLPPSSKMFGRDEDVGKLLECYERVRKENKIEVVVVKGHSGIGKSSLVETVRKPVMQAKGYYTSVKFDQIRSPVPFFAITQSLSGLLRQILAEPEAQLIVWRRRLSKALGKEGRVIADVLPSLENVFEPGWLDTLPPLVALGAQESEERFQTVVKNVLRTFARSNKPLIVVVDDLQWSTPSDIDFVLSLLSPDVDTSSHPTLLILLYRDNEVGPDHIVSTTLLPKIPEVNLTIKLEALNLANVMSFVGESLRKPKSGSVSSKSGKEAREDPSIRTLSELILGKTLGSPLFVAQLLKALNADGLFTFDFDTNRWKFDLDLIASKSVSTDVVELLFAQMSKFGPRTRHALMIAACIGTEELSAITLAQTTETSLAELTNDLLDAVEEGMLVPIGEISAATPLGRGKGKGEGDDESHSMDEDEGTTVDGKTVEKKKKRTALQDLTTSQVPAAYRFFHDRCQQAAYNLVPSADKCQTHYEIGKRLVAALPEEALLDHIFDLANQLNYGIDILTTTEERDQLAKFNYLAAVRANKSTAFEAARKYLQISWDLLGVGGWVAQPELMSQVTEALVEVEYSLTDYPAAQEYVRIFLDHSRDKVAKLRVYARSIRCASAMGDSLLAIDIGREGLAMVDVHLPKTAEEADELADVIRAELDLTPEKIEHLHDLARLSDPIASGAQAICASLVPPVFFTAIHLLGSLSSLAARGTLQHGLDDAGAFMFTLHAVLVSGKYNALAESFAYGRAATRFFETYGGTPLACPTYKVYASHIAVWSMSIRETLPSFRQAVAYGIEYRDAEYVGFGCGELCSYSLLGAVYLPEVTSDLEHFTVLVRKFRHELSTLYIAVIHQASLCLMGRSASTGELDGEAFSVADYQICIDKSYATILHLFHMLRLMIAVFFHDDARAVESIKVGRECIHGGQGLIYPVFFALFETLTFYNRYSTLTPEEIDRIAETTKLIAGLSVTAPANFFAIKIWLDAEATRAQGNTQDALALYDSAIEAATEAQYLHLAACMNERCAKMLSGPKLAAGYLIDAHRLWKQWGCGPKVSAMEAEFPKLFPSRPPPISRSSSNPTVNHGSGPRSAVETTPVPFTPAAQSHSASSDEVMQVPMDDTDQTSSHRDETSTATWHPDTVSRRRTSTGSHGSHSNSGGNGIDLDIVSASDRTSVRHSEKSARSHLATELDLRTVVSASSVISQELSVDGVVAKLMSLALRTAGAEMCLLVLDKGGMLCAEAIAKSDSSDVQHLRRVDAIDVQSDRYPCSVINYVARTRTMIVNDLDSEGDSISDAYFEHHRPLSILCLALSSQQRTIGVLYMENSQTKEAFTADRMEILSLILGQAAAAIEKARLVQDLKLTNVDLKRSQATLEGYNRNLESTVAERTLELRHKNDLLVAEVAQKERAQNELRSAKNVAESATAMKSQFLANMSHEIRTPFNAVVALAGLLLDTTLNPVQTDYVETIKNSSQELLVVINDILDYSKIELDHLELSRDAVQLRNVLESSMDMLAERAAAKSVELALIIEQGEIDIVGDLTRLRQIVVNLLSNAVKFTSDGEITVIASSEAIEPGPNGEKMCRVKIAVRDSGIGIAKEHYNRLFRVFSQVEGSETTKQFGGTGLGLAISRKLSLLMGGDITVDSEVGKGSTFTVDFVCPVAEPPEKDLFSPATNPDLAGKRCLVVDDNQNSRTVLKQLLGSFGIIYEVPEDVSNAFGIAVAAVEAGKPFDVVIIDAFLPGFAGQILLRRLRQKGINAPAIALTRMGSPIYEELRQLDCRFLIKPIKRNRLHHTLRQVFPRGDNRKATPPPQKAAMFPTGLGSRNPLSILCAEDNPVNVKVITHLLKRMGYTTDVAEDGLIALEKAQKKKYDLIFMDVNMPNMDGHEATRRICALMPDREKRPHIVCLTANAMSGDREASLEAGADGYVSKPIPVPDLVGALNDAWTKVQRRLVEEAPAPPAPTAVEFQLELPLHRRTGKISRTGSSNSSTKSNNSSPGGSPKPMSPKAMEEDK